MAEKLTIEEILAMAAQVMATIESSSGGQFSLQNPYQQNIDYMSKNPQALSPTIYSAVSQTNPAQQGLLVDAILNQATPRLTEEEVGMVPRNVIAGGVLEGMKKKAPFMNIGAAAKLAEVLSKEVEDRRSSNFGGAGGLWT